jgi:protein TonB
MHASTTYLSGGSKATKIAIVTALHLAVALGLMNMKAFRPAAPPVIVWPTTPPKVKPPVKQPDPAVAKPETLQPPPLLVPKTEVEIEKKIVAETPIAKPLPPGPVVDEGRTGGGTPDGTGPGKTVELQKAKAYSPATAGDCARPDYPARAARNGDSGTVTLALLIGTDGRVADARVARTSGSKDLDRAAVSALSLCKFKPAMNNGVAQPAWGQIAYVWSLQE